jgi:hypothetical protein
MLHLKPLLVVGACFIRVELGRETDNEGAYANNELTTGDEAETEHERSDNNNSSGSSGSSSSRHEKKLKETIS